MGENKGKDMALIKVSSPELYRAWLKYYEHHNPDWQGYQQRFKAFCNSKIGKRPPGNWQGEHIVQQDKQCQPKEGQH